MIIIPKRFQNATFSNFIADNENKIAFDAFLDYSNNLEENFQNGKNFILCGKVGTGKTHLAYAMANHIQENWKLHLTDAENKLGKVYHEKIIFTSMWDILEAIKQNFNRDFFDNEAVHLKAPVCDWLIVDEVGIQYGTDSERKMIYDLFNTRYESMLPTICLSNEKKEDLSKLLGQRIFDRLFSGAEYFYVNSKSRR